MKTTSSIDINVGRQDRAHRNQEASIRTAMRIRHWFCVMLVVLTSGMVAVAQQSNRTATGYQHSLNLTACGYGIGQCDESLLSPAEAAQVSVVRRRMNVQACGYGIGQCSEGLLSPAEAAQVNTIRRRMNVQACEYGLGLCRKSLLTPSEAAVVRSTKAGQESFVIPYPLTSMGETSAAPPTALDTQLNALLKVLPTPAIPAVAENGSYYGEPNNNGVPKTVLVNGYTRSNGTYVQGYYRSAPGTNPVR